MSGTTEAAISTLPAASAANSTDLIPATQGSTGPNTGTTRAITVAQIVAQVPSPPTQQWTAGTVGTLAPDLSLSGGTLSAIKPPVTITYATTVQPDASQSSVFKLTLNGSTTMGLPANLAAGQTLRIFIRQDSTGARSMAFASGWNFAGGIAPTLSTSPGALDLLTVEYDGTTVVGSLKSGIAAASAFALYGTPFSSDSPWNTPIPTGPTIAANSAAIVTKINSWSGPASLVAGTYGTADDFDIPVYQAASTDPLLTINVTTVDARSQQIQGMQIHVPAAAAPSSGSDAHIVIVDPGQNWYYEFWDVTGMTGGTLAAGTGGRVRVRGDGFGLPNAIGSKTASRAGIVTASELQSGVIPHAINLIVKSTDGTDVWPASGLIGNTDPTSAPPNGTWLQLNMTPSQIAALSLPAWKAGILQAMATYGAVVCDTGGASWNLRFLDDTSTAALGGSQPVKAFVQTASGWTAAGNGTAEYYGDLKTGVDWTKLQVIDPTYLSNLYASRLAAKKLNPVTDITNSWGLTGASTASACLTQSAYPPFAASTSPNLIGTSTQGNICEVRVATPNVPQGKTIVGLVAWFYGNTAAGTTYTVDLRSVGTVLGTYTVPANEGYAWYAVEATSLAGVTASDIRIRFTMGAGGGFSNAATAFVAAEFG